MKKLEISIILGFMLTILITGVTAFAKDCDDIRHDVLRLHIMANSDDQIDQQLKLSVRDEILDKTSYIFTNSESKQQAQKLASQDIDYIQDVAQNHVYELGYDYKVDTNIVSMYFNTRHYEDITMPAGVYDAIRITIGEGTGQNWWCVMFPPMCVPAASEPLTFDDEEMEILTKPKYKAEFLVVEIIEDIKNKIFS